MAEKILYIGIDLGDKPHQCFTQTQERPIW